MTGFWNIYLFSRQSRVYQPEQHQRGINPTKFGYGYPYGLALPLIGSLFLMALRASFSRVFLENRMFRAKEPDTAEIGSGGGEGLGALETSWFVHAIDSQL